MRISILSLALPLVVALASPISSEMSSAAA